MTTTDRVKRALAALWWILFPAFLVLVARFSYERACLDPYELLRPLMRHQSFALIIAAVYVGAYMWIVTAGIMTAGIMTARDRISAASSWSDAVTHAWGRDITKIVAMAVAIALEQVPRAVWAFLYHTLRVC